MPALMDVVLSSKKQMLGMMVVSLLLQAHNIAAECRAAATLQMSTADLEALACKISDLPDSSPTCILHAQCLMHLLTACFHATRHMQLLVCSCPP